MKLSLKIRTIITILPSDKLNQRIQNEKENIEYDYQRNNESEKNVACTISFLRTYEHFSSQTEERLLFFLAFARLFLSLLC